MENLLKIDNIRFTIGVNTGRVEVSGLLEEGGVLNICGPSGSGKTTLLRILAKLKETGGGSVFLQGKPWTDFSPSGWHRKVYYLAQKPAIFDGTVEENLKKPFELAAVKTDLRFDLDRAARLMERLYLPQELLTRDARTLSGGESSRVALVRALLVEPSVLLLDEPLAALDRTAASAVIELIAEWLEETGGRGAALVSHTGDIGGLSCCSILDLGGKEGDLSE